MNSKFLDRNENCLFNDVIIKSDGFSPIIKNLIQFTNLIEIV